MLSFLVANFSLSSAEDEFDWINSTLYRRYVESISYESLGSRTIATIRCSDKTRWKFIAELEDDLILDKLQNELKANMEIYLTCDDQNPKYWLGNESSFLVAIRKESLVFLPTIISMERIDTPRGILIILSDGSIWRMEGWDIFICYWKIGDHVLVGRCGSLNPQMIDIEASYECTLLGIDFDAREVAGDGVKMLVPPYSEVNSLN